MWQGTMARRLRKTFGTLYKVTEGYKKLKGSSVEDIGSFCSEDGVGEECEVGSSVD